MLVIIDNYDSFTYNLYQGFAQVTREIRVIRNDQFTVAEIAALKPSKIVISPGPKAPHQAGISVELICALAPCIPILGVCLGMQAIGEAFGGKVVLAPELVHGKDTLIRHGGEGIYQGLPSPFVAGRYHSLLVDEETLPDCLEKQAFTESGLIMGIKHRRYPCYGVQFHPESILTPQGHIILNNFIKM